MRRIASVNCLVASILSIVMAATSRAQCIYDYLPPVDLSGPVYCLLEWDDGTGPALFAGGAFAYGGGEFVGSVAKWDGVRWRPVAGGVDGEVHALAVFNGHLVAAGTFSKAGGVSANSIARFDGSAWYPLGPGLTGGPASPRVSSLAVFSGELVAAGNFTAAGSTSVGRIARWNGATWRQLGRGVGATVRALLTHNGELYVGGDFTSADAMPAGHIARWNGTAWTTVGTGVAETVHALAAIGNLLYAGGAFTDVAGSPTAYVASWNGASWDTFPTGPNGIVRQLVDWNGTLVACGDFNAFGAMPVNGLARFTGTPSFTPPLNSAPFCLGISQQALVLGGNSNLLSPVRTSPVASWTGARWVAVGTPWWGETVAFAEWRGELYAAGSLRFDDDIAQATSIVRWTGDRWVRVPGRFRHSNTAGGDTRCLAVYNDELVVGGYFDLIDDVWSPGVAILGDNGWRAAGVWYEGAQFDNLCVFHDHLIGASRSIIKQWDGATWTQLFVFGDPLVFQPTADLLFVGSTGGVRTWAFGAPSLTYAGDPFQSGGNPGRVVALASYNGGVVAAGAFTASGSVALRNVAWFDGSWHPLGAGLDAWVTSALVFRGQLLAEQGGPMRWNGFAWEPFAPSGSYGYLGEVGAMAEFQGELFVSHLYGANGLPHPGWGRIAASRAIGDADGDLDVDQDDIDIVLFNFGNQGTPGLPGDLNNDGRVDSDDVDLVLYNYGTACR